MGFGSWYWGEIGLQWWGSDSQVVGGIDGDFGGWVKTRLMGEDVGQILALLKVNNCG